MGQISSIPYWIKVYYLVVRPDGSKYIVGSYRGRIPMQIEYISDFPIVF